LKKPDSSIYNHSGVGSSYEVIQDDSTLNSYIEGLRFDKNTYPIFERLARKHSYLKDDLYGVRIKEIEEVRKRYQEQSKPNKPKLNFVNY